MIQTFRDGTLGLLDEDYEAHHPWHYDTQAQTEQHLRDEAAYPENSPWRYNDVTSGLMDDDEQRWKKARARQRLQAQEMK